MIEDCENGKIDAVICKSVSRFSRNTLSQPVMDLNIIPRVGRKNIDLNILPRLS